MRQQGELHRTRSLVPGRTPIADNPGLPCDQPNVADLTLADLHARLEHDARHAEAAMLKDGHLAPFVALTTAASSLIPVVPDFSTAEMKDASMTAVRLLAIAEGAVIASHLSEV